jgi:hypothetical protein
VTVVGLATRREPLRIGASQVADAIGVGFSSPVRVYGEIRGERGFERPPDTLAQRLGRRLQPVIFRELWDEGYSVHEYANDYTVTDTARPWLTGHPDGCGSGELDGLVVDAKARSWLYDEKPTRVQLLIYMHLGDYAAGMFARLHNLTLTVHEVERDQHAIDTALYLLERFWEYVERGEWPPVTGHPDDRAALATAHPGKRGLACRETREIRGLRRELKAMNDADAKHGARSARKNYLAGRIQEHMGEAVEMKTVHDDVVARWTPQTSRRFDTKAFERDHPDLYAQYVKASESRRFSLV